MIIIIVYRFIGNYSLCGISPPVLYGSPWDIPEVGGNSFDQEFWCILLSLQKSVLSRIWLFDIT